MRNRLDDWMNEKTWGTALVVTTLLLGSVAVARHTDEIPPPRPVAGKDTPVPKKDGPAEAAPTPKDGSKDRTELADVLKDIRDKDTTKLEAKIIDALVANKQPNFQDVTDAWLEVEVRRYNEARRANLDLDDVKNTMRFAVINSTAGQWSELKSQLITRTKRRLRVDKFVNNKEATSPLDVLYAGKADAGAFTAMMHLAARHAWGSVNYPRFRPVTLFVHGDVLPGVIISRSGKDHVVGLDTSVDGKGERDFGPTDKLSELSEPVRMVDGEAFAIYEIFKDRLGTVGRHNLVQALVKQAGERYRHNHRHVENRVAEATKDLKPEQMPPEGSVGYGLAFGLPAHAAGDRVRVAMDVVKPEQRVIAPPSVVPPVVGTPLRVRTAAELLVVLKTDTSDHTLKKMSDLELQAKIDSMIRESVAAWRVNKESENREIGTPIKKLEELKFSATTTATLKYFLDTQTEALIPAAAKEASKAVYDAKVAAERMATEQLKDKNAMQIRAIFDEAAYGARTAALKTDPMERNTILDREIGAVLDKYEVTGDARTKVAPLLKTLEQRRFVADAAWRRVLLPGLPDAPPAKKDALPPAKKDGPPVKKDDVPAKKDEAPAKKDPAPKK